MKLKSTWRNYGWKLSTFGNRYKLTDSRTCAKPKQDKLKEILIITKLLKTNHKEKNTEISEKKNWQLCIEKKKKNGHEFPKINNESQKEAAKFIHVKKEKTISLESDTQQNYLPEMKKKSRHSQIKKE